MKRATSCFFQNIYELITTSSQMSQLMKVELIRLLSHGLLNKKERSLFRNFERLYQVSMVAEDLERISS